MYVTSKDSSHDGRSHLLQSVIESDGASELVRADQKLSASVVKIARTASGGIQLDLVIVVSDPLPEPSPEPKTKKANA